MIRTSLRKKAVIGAALTITLTSTAPALSAPTYTITALEPLHFHSAHDFNDAGQVVGHFVASEPWLPL
jgi:hypothetical protein